MHWKDLSFLPFTILNTSANLFQMAVKIHYNKTNEHKPEACLFVQIVGTNCTKKKIETKIHACNKTGKHLQSTNMWKSWNIEKSGKNPHWSFQIFLCYIFFACSYTTYGYVNINYKSNFSLGEWLGLTNGFMNLLVALEMVLWLAVNK